MLANPSIFKAYDIRGKYPGEINEEAVRAIASAYAVFLKPRTVAVGRDVRLSGPALMGEAVEALVQSGVRVVDIGVLPVDAFYFAVSFLKCDGGIFISASHNPREWNGLNLARKGSEPITGDSGLKEIAALAMSGARIGGKQRGDVRTENVEEAYLDFVAKNVSLRLRPIKAVIAGSFGVSAKWFRALSDRHRLPLTLVGLDDEPDGNFPKGTPDPLIPENRAEICALVQKARADLGIAWDADGDRCFFIDEEGNFIAGYFITALLAGELLRQNPGATIIADPRLIWATQDAVRAQGGRLVITRPGMTLIAERMKKENAVFAGEMSSHFYFKETFNRDNGFLPALMVLNMMARENKKLSELAAPFTKKYFISGEINFEIKNKEGILKRAEERYRSGKIEHIDGVSAEFPDWRFNLRASNTEDLLRLNLEARDANLLRLKLGEITEMIKSGE